VLPGVVLLLSFAGAASALTVDVAVTPAYLREHRKELSLKTARRPDGLLEFTITRTSPERRYFVARLLLRREGKTVVETSIPSYGKKNSNQFFFALAPESLDQAEFELSEAFVGGSAAEPIPLPGTKNLQFRLRDHVTEVLTKRPTGE
jgi:hypothetical protein